MVRAILYRSHELFPSASPCFRCYELIWSRGYLGNRRKRERLHRLLNFIRNCLLVCRSLFDRMCLRSGETSIIAMIRYINIFIINFEHQQLLTCNFFQCKRSRHTRSFWFKNGNKRLRHNMDYAW